MSFSRASMHRSRPPTILVVPLVTSLFYAVTTTALLLGCRIVRLSAAFSYQAPRRVGRLSAFVASMPVSTRNHLSREFTSETKVGAAAAGMIYSETRQWAAAADGDADVTLTTPKGKGKRKMERDAASPTALNENDMAALVSVVTPSPTKSRKRKVVLDKQTDDDDDNLPISTLQTPQKAATKTPTKKVSSSASRPPKAISPPKEDWLAIYTLVQELRQDRTAPCDHSGCEALAAEQSMPSVETSPLTMSESQCTKDHPASPPTTPEYRFQVLISLMLSSQTKDAVVGAAVRALKADGVLDVHAIAKMDANVLKRYIEKIGFYNNKTKYIKEAVEILISNYNGDIPRTAAEMIRDLPGVGPKMAYICEGAAWNTYTGIGVDTHMHRIFNLLHWVKSNTPEQTRVQLESWLPVEHWPDVNLLWVGFGQELQQEKPKLLKKVLQCSRPKEALRLLQRCKFDYRKVANECGIDLDAIQAKEESPTL